MITRGEALLALRPGAEWNMLNGEISWLDSEQTQPTEDEIAEKIAELEYKEEVEEYKAEREKAYPPTGEQFDKIFHEGIDAWKAEIQAIKDAHPKAVIDNDTLEARKSQALFDKKLAEYTTAIERLAQYELSVGKPAVTEVQSKHVQQVDGDDNLVFDDDMNPVYETVEETVILESAIEPLTHEQVFVDGVIGTAQTTTSSVNDDGEVVEVEEEYRNPLIVEDEAERTTAQSVIDSTPQAVIDAYEA